jgi:exonuclease SbcD
MTRLAITADVHADDYFSRIDPETGMNARFVDMVTTARNVASQAHHLDADALIVAGDYTESKTPARSPRAAKIAQAFDAGPKRQVHLRGNHDAEWAGESIVSLFGRTDGWDGYTVPGMSIIGDPTDPANAVVICVIPYLDRKWARVLPELANETDAVVYHELAERYLTMARGMYEMVTRGGARNVVFVGHQQLRGAQMTDTQRAFLGERDLLIDANDLGSIGYTAVVMGHVHRPQLVAAPAPGNGLTGPVIYAGSQERVDFAEEHEDKSFVLLDIGPSGLERWETIPIYGRRFVTLRGSANFDGAEVEGAIVRAIDLNVEVDGDLLRHDLMTAGAFAVTSVKRPKVERAATRAARAVADAGGPDEQLAAYFAGRPNAERLVERGRRILSEVVA